MCPDFQFPNPETHPLRVRFRPLCHGLRGNLHALPHLLHHRRDHRDQEAQAAVLQGLVERPGCDCSFPGLRRCPVQPLSHGGRWQSLGITSGQSKSVCKLRQHQLLAGAVQLPHSRRCVFLLDQGKLHFLYVDRLRITMLLLTSL